MSAAGVGLGKANKSWVWTLSHRGEGELENYAICNLCGQRIKMSDNSPSNMSNHLLNSHKDEALRVKEMFFEENGGGKRKKGADEDSNPDERKKGRRPQQADDSVSGLVAEARQRLQYETPMYRAVPAISEAAVNELIQALNTNTQQIMQLQMVVHGLQQNMERLSEELASLRDTMDQSTNQVVPSDDQVV